MAEPRLKQGRPRWEPPKRMFSRFRYSFPGTHTYRGRSIVVSVCDYVGGGDPEIVIRIDSDEGASMRAGVSLKNVDELIADLQAAKAAFLSIPKPTKAELVEKQKMEAVERKMERAMREYGLGHLLRKEGRDVRGVHVVEEVEDPA